MTDYAKMEPADMLHTVNDDAWKWATAFCQCNPSVEVDEETMMIWFANAIERSHDYRTGQIINGDHAQYLIDKGLER